MTIPTPKSLRNAHRRLDRRNAAQQGHQLTVARVLNEMQKGASLHRCNRRTRTIWVLSNGEFVTVEAAAAVLADPRVVGAGDSLFGQERPELSQTFWWLDG